MNSTAPAWMLLDIVQEAGRAPGTTDEVALSNGYLRIASASTPAAPPWWSCRGAARRPTLSPASRVQRFTPNTDAPVCVVQPRHAAHRHAARRCRVHPVPGEQVPRPITWNDVLRAILHPRLVVVARSVVESPPPRSAVPYYRLDASLRLGAPSGRSAATTGPSASLRSCVVEIAFLAGPAFAIVLADSQRREHRGLSGLGGWPARAMHGRWFSAAESSGCRGCVIGVVLGIIAGLALRHWRISRRTDFGGLHLHGWRSSAPPRSVCWPASWLPLVPARTQHLNRLSVHRPAGDRPGSCARGCPPGSGHACRGCRRHRLRRDPGTTHGRRRVRIGVGRTSGSRRACRPW